MGHITFSKVNRSGSYLQKQMAEYIAGVITRVGIISRRIIASVLTGMMLKFYADGLVKNPHTGCQSSLVVVDDH